jgi:drug/metabolite transporter (DMT)-like permease
MNGVYLLGVASAIGAGITFNLGMVVQKVAVRRQPTRSVAPGQAGLMRQLVRSPLWLAGFALQFFVGMPLYMLAQAYLGPALIPGLMAIGLIVMAIAAVWLAHEVLDLSDVAGIVLVVVAVALIGVSGLRIDMQRIDVYEREFLARLVFFTAAVAGLSLGCHALQRRSLRACGVLRTLNAGLLFVQSNLWLGVIMAILARWGAGQFSLWDLVPAAAAAAITFAGSMLGIAETQRAFQAREATRLVPIQSVPVQILPLASYFAVFRLAPSGPAALPLAGLGAAVILAGSALLARRQVAFG